MLFSFLFIDKTVPLSLIRFGIIYGILFSFKFPEYILGHIWKPNNNSSFIDKILADYGCDKCRRG